MNEQLQSPDGKPVVMMPEMCRTHVGLLVHQARYAPSDPWRALVTVSTIALFQGASADPKVQKELDGDITRMQSLGCLACRKPDLFGEIVEKAKHHDLGRIKKLGESWLTTNKGTV